MSADITITVSGPAGSGKSAVCQIILSALAELRARDASYSNSLGEQLPVRSEAQLHDILQRNRILVHETITRS